MFDAYQDKIELKSSYNNFEARTKVICRVTEDLKKNKQDKHIALKGWRNEVNKFIDIFLGGYLNLYFKFLFKFFFDTFYLYKYNMVIFTYKIKKKIGVLVV